MRNSKIINTLELLTTIKDAEKIMNTQSENVKRVLIADIEMAKKAINRLLFGFEKVNIDDTHWESIVSKCLMQRADVNNSYDEQFFIVRDVIKYVPSESIFNTCKSNYLNLDSEKKDIVTKYYQCYHNFWGTLKPDEDNYQAIWDKVSSVKEYIEEFEWLYNKLADYRSKYVLINYLKYCISFDSNCVQKMRENNFPDYWDLDLLPRMSDEIIVDLGGYNGDTIIQYADLYGEDSYKAIYSFEMSPYNVLKMRERLRGFKNVHIVPKAVGAKEGTVCLQFIDGVHSCNSLYADYKNYTSYTEKTEVEITTVDSEINDRITLIKMDVEGAEQEALKGCRRHITEEHPKLLICVYHNNEDIWKVPSIIHSMDESYRFYLRSNGDQVGPSEIVLFAL